eukprot:CAMPEP_0171937704 /NCGR_PEP_ID=MMETSP0993-20121228/34834_1 /TAXON_ID=483369 /ORGANISM="non described non described, Strain CCMP2098" /LENGTH=95 /DNA_ID=CAMNT_0012579105 /DNA_START=1 /DNA_END=285 /DNA_ORIENTATION=+
MENDMKSVKRRIGKSVAGRRKREYEKLNNGDRQKRPRSKRPQAPSHGHVRVEDDYQGEEEEEERVEENGEDESGFDDSNREFVLVVVDTGARDVL